MNDTQDVVNNIVQAEVLGPRTKPETTLKSVFGTPSFLKSILIFSVIINILLLCGVIGVASQESGSPARTTITPIALASETPTPIVTESVEEKEQQRRDCFENCESRDFLNSLKLELENVKYYKAIRDMTDSLNKKCLGYYNEVTSPDKVIALAYRPVNCPDGYIHETTVQSITIGNKSYLSLDGKSWETRTVQPDSQTELLDIIDLLQEQQKITTEYETRGTQRVRVLTAESEKVNDFNQVVKVSTQIKVNIDYQIVYYFNSEDNLLNENVRFWDYNVPNKIDAPI